MRPARLADTPLAMMFAALIFSCIAIYMFLGWIAVLVLDRRIASRRRGGLWFAMLVWPLTVLFDLIHRGGPNRP
jgi:hypothetical protein